MFVIYTPPLHVVFGGTQHLSPLYWLIPVAFGCLLLVWASIRVLLMRKSVENARVKDIKGLMMCEWDFNFSRHAISLMYFFSPYDAYDEHALKTLIMRSSDTCSQPNDQVTTCATMF